MNIRYCAPLKDYSGYGEAGRHDLASLVSAGFDVSVECTRHCLEISEFGELGQMVAERENVDNKYKVKILHTTPNIFGQFIEPGCYHIGRVFWETDVLPPDFARGAEMCDEIWTGSEFNAQAIRNAGVTKPIYIVPEAIVTDIDYDEIKPFITDQDETTYKFYSVFEWTERKNPRALLEAYFKEFQNDENVSLNLKTYVDNFTPEKKAEIERLILEIKTNLNLDTYPPLFICTELLDREQMYRFHKTFDCFVSAHRGEGWGIPQMEAMLMGKHMISTGCGGIHEYLPAECLIKYEMIPIRLATRNAQWYREDQHWADCDVTHLMAQLRIAYNSRPDGSKLHDLVVNKFDVKVVGEIMKKRLNEVSGKLGIA
jgi:glycosyltransferase involved in cell wall biosynthesis